MKGERKPTELLDTNVYADFDEAKKCFVYIGAPYYDLHAQIHLSREQFLLLADWMTKAAKWTRKQRPKPAPKKKKRGTG